MLAKVAHQHQHEPLAHLVVARYDLYTSMLLFIRITNQPFAESSHVKVRG